MWTNPLTTTTELTDTYHGTKFATVAALLDQDTRHRGAGRRTPTRYDNVSFRNETTGERDSITLLVPADLQGADLEAAQLVLVAHAVPGTTADTLTILTVSSR